MFPFFPKLESWADYYQIEKQSPQILLEKNPYMTIQRLFVGFISTLYETSIRQVTVTIERTIIITSESWRLCWEYQFIIETMIVQSPSNWFITKYLASTIPLYVWSKVYAEVELNRSLARKPRQLLKLLYFLNKFAHHQKKHLLENYVRTSNVLFISRWSCDRVSLKKYMKRNRLEDNINLVI